ncbi:sulfite exporter TauE/SafE family protein [Shimia abyssi]|uniref:Probable membrane transporter protein n=1 Tax=Shimia abyssi TaxID=1662395 RepID=A0A2P8FDE8_9RHOB|nr:sulfite exporter TauE/SafE family protein [Shimia abyssi]PSL19733.1 putative membrane protein YfcA [Shimia abyssi]
MDTAFVVITLASLIASFVNAAFATGGVYILLIASVSVLPISAAVPLQSAFAAGSLSARIYYFWRHIDWRIVRTFVVGCLFGVYFGTRTFVVLPDAVISTALGCVLLVLIWLPKGRINIPLRHPFFLVGVTHSFLGAMFGVGGVLQPLLLRTDLLKLQVTGTLAACLLTLDVMKVTGYVSFGFSYFDYIPHIIGATLAGFVGTSLGKRATHHVSETLFRRVFRILVSLIALRLIYKGLTLAS